MPDNAPEREKLEDSEKYERVYRLYQSPMLRLAFRLLGNAQDAEDAVHDAFVSIAKNLDKFSDPESPRTRGYMMVITERKAIDILRDRQRRGGVELDEEQVSIPFPDRGAHDLMWCLSQLPPRYREILLLRFVYGYNMREVGELMDISYATVGKVVQRARERLYELCAQEGLL